MGKTYLKWALNINVAIAIFFLIISYQTKTTSWVLLPYIVFALANWLFADIIFNQIPDKINIGRRTISTRFFSDTLIAFSITLIIFKLSHRYLFDDAGFVLRYVENIPKGHFYKFNPADPPVYGLSGFIYGILCFTFRLVGIPATVSLKLVNFIGASAYVFLLLQICRHLIKDKRVAWLVFILMALGLDSVVLMFTTGLELPVHIAIICATILFYLKNKAKLFLIFCAISIISKLDALPLVALLIAFYTWETIILKKDYKSIFKVILFTGIPLGSWLIFAWLYFGSPLPQSAFAKYYYHLNPDKHAFPFLFYFLDHPIRKHLVIPFEIFAIFHLIQIIWYRKFEYVKPFLFGCMLIGILTLYYFYNPLERMIWYYSLPHFLLLGQVLFSFVYWFSKLRFLKIYLFAAIPLLYIMVPVMRKMNDRFEYNEFYTQRVERERYHIGKYMYEISLPTDTLMSSHGLVSWKFKGHVIDLSGLNSKLVTDYKRNQDSLLSDFKPHYIINHSWPHVLNIYGKHGFEIDQIFGDVSFFGYPYWALMKRAPELKRGYAWVPQDKFFNAKEIKQDNEITQYFSDSLYINLSGVEGSIQKMWASMKREDQNFTIEIKVYKDSILLHNEIQNIETRNEDLVSKYSKGIEIPLQIKGQQANAVCIVPKGVNTFVLFGPLLEFAY